MRCSDLTEAERALGTTPCKPDPLNLAHVAARGLHMGRHATIGNVEAIQPWFVGHEPFIRGYALESFLPFECPPPPLDPIGLPLPARPREETCPTFARPPPPGVLGGVCVLSLGVNFWPRKASPHSAALRPARPVRRIHGEVERLVYDSRTACRSVGSVMGRPGRRASNCPPQLACGSLPPGSERAVPFRSRTCSTSPCAEAWFAPSRPRKACPCRSSSTTPRRWSFTPSARPSSGTHPGPARRGLRLGIELCEARRANQKVPWKTLVGSTVPAMARREDPDRAVGVAALPLEKAVDQVEAWRESPSLVIIAETDGYWERLSDLLLPSRVSGRPGSRRQDALCLHHGVRELWSADRDFGRFPELRVRNPLIG